MKTTKFITLTIIHPTFGKIVFEDFTDAIQLKLFLKMVQASLDTEKNFHHFNMNDTLIQIPFQILSECIIFTNSSSVTFTEQVLAKVTA